MGTKKEDDRFGRNDNNYGCWELCEFYDMKRKRLLKKFTKHVYELMFGKNSQILQMFTKYTMRFLNAKIKKYVKDPANESAITFQCSNHQITIDYIDVTFQEFVSPHHVKIEAHTTWKNLLDGSKSGGRFTYAFPLKYHNAIANTYEDYRLAWKLRSL